MIRWDIVSFLLIILFVVCFIIVDRILSGYKKRIDEILEVLESSTIESDI
jgi:hypothetical protein